MTKYFTAICILTGLSACGGTTVTVPQTVPQFIDSENNAPVVTNASYMIRDRNAQTAALGAPQTVTAQALPQADGSVHIAVEGLGHEVVLTPDDLDESGMEYMVNLANGQELYFWTRSGTWQDVLDGNTGYDYVFTFGLSDYGPDLVNDRLEGVIGLVTAQEDMPVNGSAEYYGTTQGTLAVGDNWTGANGDVYLDISFRNGTVSGDITDFGDDAGRVNIGIEETSLNATGFSADLTLDPLNCSRSCEADFEGNISGGFYGPQAIEAGGNVTMTAQGVRNDDGEYDAIYNGSFIAAQGTN